MRVEQNNMKEAFDNEKVFTNRIYCTFKNGNKKIMIYGRRQIQVTSGKIFDYVACFYPEGNVNEEYTFLFNHEEVDKVIFKGYSNEEEEFDKYLFELE